MKENKKKDFKVGDAVECLLKGSGAVVSVLSKYNQFPIGVSFNGNIQWYTEYGQYFIGGNVVLTTGTWDVKEKPVEITYKVGELVWADLGYGDGWQVFEYYSKTAFHYVVSPQKAQERRLRAVSNDNIRKFKDNPYV